MNLGVWVFYFLGQFFHFALKAQLAVKSSINGVTDYKHYLKERWLNLSARLFANVLIFLLVWDNPQLADLPNLNMTVGVKLAISGLLGLAMDSLLDKVAAKIPFLQKEIPKVNGEYIACKP